MVLRDPKKRKHAQRRRYRSRLKPKQWVLIIGLLGVLTLIVSAFFLWPNGNDKNTEMALVTTPKITTTPSPVPIATEEPTPIATVDTPVVLGNMKPYLERNSDTIGYIKINDTVIDYPVVYSGDNEYYMDHSFEKDESKAGHIFLDFRCNTKEPERNMILYGHHMKNGSMFAQLMKYKDREFFESHPTMSFNTLYEEHEWEIFAAYVTDTSFYYINTDFHNDAEWLEFIRTCQEKSQYPTDVILTEDDIILTLSTCTYEYDDARYVVQARLIQDEN